jgi:hypothetical protein
MPWRRADLDSAHPSTMSEDTVAEFGKNVLMKRPGQPAELPAAYVNAGRSVLKLRIWSDNRGNRRKAHFCRGATRPNLQSLGRQFLELSNGFTDCIRHDSATGAEPFVSRHGRIASCLVFDFGIELSAEQNDD